MKTPILLCTLAIGTFLPLAVSADPAPDTVRSLTTESKIHASDGMPRVRDTTVYTKNDRMRPARAGFGSPFQGNADSQFPERSFPAGNGFPVSPGK